MSERLYHQVVEITEEYLGPAAPRFVTRQIAAHLQKSPEELSNEDLPKLIEWGRVSLALFTENQDVINDYTSKLERLVVNHA